MKEYKDFVPDITKIQKCKINKIKTPYNFYSYEYLNEKNMVIKRDEVYYEEDKEIILSTKIYKYEHNDFYCKDIYYFFGTNTHSIIQYKKNNNSLHNPIGPALMEFDEYGILRKCSYFINNCYHRIDGPAIEWYDENHTLLDASYYLNGQKITDDFRIAVINASKK